MEEARTWSETLPAYEDRGLEMVMVSIDPNETEQSIETFNQRAGVTEPLSTVLNGADVAQKFNANALETTVILDGNGEEVFRDVTITDAETMKRELDNVL